MNGIACFMSLFCHLCEASSAGHLDVSVCGMARVMRAIRVTEFGGLDTLKYATDAPVPTPKPNEVLVRVRASGVNPVDTYIRAGNYSGLPKLPYTPGSDVAGVVDQVGGAVSKYKKGDRVYSIRTSSGGYAEFATVDERLAFPLPDKLTFLQGAACGVPYFTAYKALHIRAQVKPGDTVLVHGASGGVGLAACQLARGFGCTVIGTAGTPEGVQLVKQNGAHFTANHRDEKYLQDIKGFTEGAGVDVILEMLANVNLQNDLEILKKYGRVIIIGSRGPIEITPRLTMGKDSDIRGMALFASDLSEFATMGAYLTAGFEAGWLNPVIGEEYSLGDARKAQEEVIQHTSGTKGKIVLTVD